MEPDKNIEFYNDYFNKLSSFELIEGFKESNEDNKSYIGTIKGIGTIHPLVIKVYIPKTFPHHKLIFTTSSLFGYPHLIYTKETKDSWFCLNTPFAETAEEQLNQELKRLVEWIDKQMRSDLKPIIDDNDIISALRRANAYEWENLDEMNEYSQESMLTFVGDFAVEQSIFKENIGHLNCIRNNSNRYYAFESNEFAKEKLPYIIIDKIPDNLDDFFAMKSEFNWTDEICEHLLPDLYINEHPSISENSLHDVDLPLAEALERFEKGVRELIIPDIHRKLLESKFIEIRENIKKNNGTKKFDFKEELAALDKQRIEDPVGYYLDYDKSQYSQYGLHYFAIGVKYNATQIFWIIFSSNQENKKYEKTEYCIDVKKLYINNLISLPLNRQPAQYLDESDYFGRGRFSLALCEKKVAIIGLGAIGSMVAEFLVRSGIKEFDLWDNDVVEPVNLCRSIYSIQDIGNNKSEALTKRIKSISPFCKVRNHGYWDDNDRYNNLNTYRGGDFYGNINYNSQVDVIKQLECDNLIIDCTASNELLHFLSFAFDDKDIISLCITNKAKQLIMTTNKNGNPFELRKILLAKIEQDTKNMYLEGTGCYSPTFLAKDCDISALVGLAIRDIDKSQKNNEIPHTTVWSYDRRGVLEDKYISYELENDNNITLNISSETYMDGEDLTESNGGLIGYLLGGYENDGKNIIITHIISEHNAEDNLKNIYSTSNGIIDYIGDFVYTTENNTINECFIDTLANKAIDENINTNNPLLCIKNTNGEISFYLHINNKLEKFTKIID